MGLTNKASIYNPGLRISAGKIDAASPKVLTSLPGAAPNWIPQGSGVNYHMQQGFFPAELYVVHLYFSIILLKLLYISFML